MAGSLKIRKFQAGKSCNECNGVGQQKEEADLKSKRMRTASEVVAALLLAPANRLLNRRTYRLGAATDVHFADDHPELSIGVYKPLLVPFAYEKARKSAFFSHTSKVEAIHLLYQNALE